MAQQRLSNTETKEDLVKQIEQLRPDVSEIAKTLGELTKGEAAELRSQKNQAADDITSEIRNLEHKVDENMRQRPLQTLAVAAGLGLLIGMPTRR